MQALALEGNSVTNIEKTQTFGLIFFLNVDLTFNKYFSRLCLEFVCSGFQLEKCFFPDPNLATMNSQPCSRKFNNAKLSLLDSLFICLKVHCPFKDSTSLTTLSLLELRRLFCKIKLYTVESKSYICIKNLKTETKPCPYPAFSQK